MKIILKHFLSLHILSLLHFYFYFCVIYLLTIFFSKKEYTPLVKIYTNSIPFSGRPCLDYPILHKKSHLFILHFHMCL